jgi:hypothetical protein
MKILSKTPPKLRNSSLHNNMRMSFRQFMIETGGLSSAGYGANTRYGFWGFPSLNQAGLAANMTPAGGFTSLSQYAQQRQQYAQFNDPDFIFQRTLDMLAQLAENVSEVIIHKNRSQQQDPNYTGMKYKYANLSKAQQIITGLTYRDITSGMYQRIRPEEFGRARKAGIFVKSGMEPPQGYNVQQEGDLYDFNVGALKNAMVQMSVKLAKKQHGYQSMSHLTGLADKAIDSASSGGMVTLGHNVNTMQ